MTTEQEVAAILTGWTVTTCADNGAFWTIAGLDPYGRAHSGSRADPIELAHDLARLVEPPPVLAPVEPAPIMATADPEPTPPTAQAIQPDLAPPASAGVEEASPASAPAAPAYPGTMLREDRENFLRGQITVRATRIEQNRLQGRFDVNAQERQRWGFTTYHNLSDLGQPIPDDVSAAHEEFLQADGWIRATKAHADNLRAAAISVPLEMLEAMQNEIEEGWP
jgi:hypothetical protein